MAQIPEMQTVTLSVKTRFWTTANSSVKFVSDLSFLPCQESLFVLFFKDVFMSNETQSFLSQLLISIISISLGSFLFAGILESYKKDQDLQEEFIKDYFRPMMKLQSSCSSSHNELFLKYGELSASYQLMYNEIVHMAMSPDSELGQHYEVLPMSLIKTNEELKKVEDLEMTVKKCNIDLFLKYEELALVTGSYPEFKRLAKKHTNTINSIYSERQKKQRKMQKI